MLSFQKRLIKLDKIVNIDDYRRSEEPLVRTVKKKRVRKSFKIVLAVVLIIIALAVFLRSPLFIIKEIKVVGNENVSYEKIIALAEIDKAENLFAIDKGDIAQRLCAYPFVEQAQLSRKIPHTLVIEIVEREPAGFIVTNEGYVQFDKSGMVLAVTNSMGHYNLPIITGIEVGQIPSPGAKLEESSFSNALNVINNCDEQVLSNLAEINIGKNNYVSAYTYHGIEIKIGDSRDIAMRLQNLKDILAQILEESININTIEYIDVRYKDVPVIKFKSNIAL